MNLDIAQFWAEYGKELVSGTSTILGAILGAGFTVIGVHMTNRSNQRTIQQQLQHEKELRRDDYQMNLRRDVYLGLAEVVGAQLDLISKLNHFDKTNPELFERLLSLSGNEAKVHVIAGTEILMELATFNQDYGQTQHSLIAERNRIAHILRGMRTNQDLAKEQSDKVDHYIELIAKVNLEGELNGHKQHVLNANYEHHKKFRQTFSDQAKSLGESFNQELVDFTVLCQQERIRLTSTLGPLVAAVRKELHLDISPDDYKKISAVSIPYTVESVRNLFNIAAEDSKVK